MRMKTTGLRFRPLLLGLLLPLFAACTGDNSDDGQVTPYSDGTVSVEMTIQTLSSPDDGYVDGSYYENYIDIVNGDYRIYFFTYDPETETGAGEGLNSTLIAEFAPTDIFSTDTGVYATYYASGEVEASVTEYSDFKVVMLANWGIYPEVEIGTTTIDDICNAETFSAFVDDTGTSPAAAMPSSSLHIPFYGVHEYSGVEWKSGFRTNLDGVITLLRAVAKVEVIFVNDEDSEEEYAGFSEVSLHRYNSVGYCAPASVYLQSDYDHNYTWGEDFVNGLHLVGNGNDSDNTTTDKSFLFQKVQERVWDETTNRATQYETWVAYLPEYDNMGEDFSYMTVTSGSEYTVYFAEYTSGTTDNTDTSSRWNIYRNYLYRFNVSMSRLPFEVNLTILPWVERTDDIEF